MYPFGKQGLLLKQILNWQYGIEEAFILDDKLCKTNPDIKPLSYLEQIDTSQYTFIITSDNLNYWDELRQNIRMYVKEEYIIDMYASKPLRYSETRIASLEMAAREIYARKIGGVCAEAGVYQGRFASYINEFFPDKKLYLFDTFEGFPDKDVEIDRENGYTLADNSFFRDTSVDIVLNKMKYREKIIVKKGYFPDTTDGIEEMFCFVSLDMDMYLPIKAGIEYFYPRLVAGGYIFIHDCNIEHSSFKGARKALIEFAERERVGYVMLPDNCTAVIVK